MLNPILILQPRLPIPTLAGAGAGRFGGRRSGGRVGRIGRLCHARGRDGQRASLGQPTTRLGLDVPGVEPPEPTQLGELLRLLVYHHFFFTAILGLHTGQHFEQK